MDSVLVQAEVLSGRLGTSNAVSGWRVAGQLQLICAGLFGLWHNIVSPWEKEMEVNPA